MVHLMQEGTSDLNDNASVPGQILEDIPWCAFPFSFSLSSSSSLLSLVVRYVPAWFPFAEFKRRALQWRVSLADMRDILFDYAVSVGIVIHQEPLISPFKE